jgi:hypothetical protein
MFSGRHGATVSSSASRHEVRLPSRERAIKHMRSRAQTPIAELAFAITGAVRRMS